MPNLKNRTNTVGRTLRLEGATVAIKHVLKRGIIIHHPSPRGVVSYTLTDNNGEWCGEGQIKAEHYSEESVQFLRGFLDFNCPVTSHGASSKPVARAPSRRRNH